MSDQPTARELALYHALRSVIWTLRSRDIHFGQDNTENMAYWDSILDAMGAAFYIDGETHDAKNPLLDWLEAQS